MGCHSLLLDSKKQLLRGIMYSASSCAVSIYIGGHGLSYHTITSLGPSLCSVHWNYCQTERKKNEKKKPNPFLKQLFRWVHGGRVHPSKEIHSSWSRASTFLCAPLLQASICVCLLPQYTRRPQKKKKKINSPGSCEGLCRIITWLPLSQSRIESQH